MTPLGSDDSAYIFLLTSLLSRLSLCVRFHTITSHKKTSRQVGSYITNALILKDWVCVGYVFPNYP